MNRQDCLRGTKVGPFPGPSNPDTPENLSSPSPHPYIEMGMVMMLKQGVPGHTRLIYPATTAIPLHFCRGCLQPVYETFKAEEGRC
jgi:hypothetical protein